MNPTTRRQPMCAPPRAKSALDRRPSNLHRTNAASGMNMPVEEFIDSEGKFVVRMDLPGMHPCDIDSKFRQGRLVIKGRRRRNSDALRKNLGRSEVTYGRFRRSLALPSRVRTSNVEIQYEHGVLELRLKMNPGT